MTGLLKKQSGAGKGETDIVSQERRSQVYIEDRVKELENTIETLTTRIVSLENKGADKFVTARELAQIMGCSENNIYVKYRAGELVGTKKTGGVRFPLSQFYEEEKNIIKIPLKKKKEPQSIKEKVFG